MNVLIVGGAGYLGGALTDLLKGSAHNIRVYDNLTFEDTYLKDIPFVFGDIRDHKKLKGQLDWADAVVWLAALVGDGACAINPAVTKELNEDSVKWLSENFDGRIIFMSTCSVYGAQDGELTEDSPTNPLSIYAQTKLAAEGYLKDKNAIIFRLGTLFGVGDAYSRIRLDLVVNTLTCKAMQTGEITVFGGEQYRPLLHVKDAARAIQFGLYTNSLGRTGIYNAASTNIKILDLAKEVANIVPCQIKTVETSFEDSRNYRASQKRLSGLLKFDHTIQDGINEIATLMTEERIRDPDSPRFNNYGYLNNFKHWEQYGTN